MGHVLKFTIISIVSFMKKMILMIINKIKMISNKIKIRKILKMMKLMVNFFIFEEIMNYFKINYECLKIFCKKYYNF